MKGFISIERNNFNLVLAEIVIMEEEILVKWMAELPVIWIGLAKSCPWWKEISSHKK